MSQQSVKLAGRVHAGVTTAQTARGGHGSALRGHFDTHHHYGGIVVVPGCPDPVQLAEDAEESAPDHPVERLLDVSRRLGAGN